MRAIFTAQFVFEHRMACSFQLQLAASAKFRDAGIEVAGKTGAGKNAVQFGNGCGGGLQGPAGLQSSGELFQDAKNFGGFIFGKLNELIVGLDGFEWLDENGLPCGAGAMDHALHGAAMFGAHRNDEAVVAQGDIVFADSAWRERKICFNVF